MCRCDKRQGGAVAINDKEVLCDDLTSECAKLRASIKEILDSISDSENKKEAFVSLCHADDEPEVDRPAPMNNKYYYISAAVGAFAILLLVHLLRPKFLKTFYPIPLEKK